MSLDKLKLLMGRPLPLDVEKGIHVHQPLIKEIVDMGEDFYNSLSLPFILTLDSIFSGAENEEELSSKFHLFDLFFVNIEDDKYLLDAIFGEKALDSLSNSLRYFLKTDDIRVLYSRKKIVVDNKYMIDSEEFDRLRPFIQAVTCREDIEVDKPPKNMSQRQKDIWMKLQKGRKRNAEKNAIHLQDLINYTVFGGKSYISYNEVDNMTYYQMYNAYKSIIGVDTYAMSMSYKVSPKFDVKDDIKHWTETIKIGK